MTAELTHRGGCHCGAVRFAFEAPATVDVTDCNCSLCRMSGYEHVFVPEEKLRFLSGEDVLTIYTFNTHAAKHSFCRICGVKPLYRPRSHPAAWSVNLRCVEAGTLTVGRRIAFEGRDWEANIAGLKAET